MKYVWEIPMSHDRLINGQGLMLIIKHTNWQEALQATCLFLHCLVFFLVNWQLSSPYADGWLCVMNSSHHLKQNTEQDEWNHWWMSHRGRRGHFDLYITCIIHNYARKKWKYYSNYFWNFWAMTYLLSQRNLGETLR